MPSIKNEGDSDGDDDMSGAESQHSGSSRGPGHDRDSSGEDADEPDSDDSSEMDESECERRRYDCINNLGKKNLEYKLFRKGACEIDGFRFSTFGKAIFNTPRTTVL